MRRKAIFILVFLLLAQTSKAQEPSLLISEIMYDVSGSDSGHEWLEFYNFGSEPISASSTWRFFDGSNHSLNLFCGSSTIFSQEYFVLVDNGENFLLDYPNFSGTVFDTVLSLPNSNSSIAFSFDGGQTHPVSASYDSSWGASGNGYSLEKIELNQNSGADNWQESFIFGGTPGLVNSTSSPETPPEEDNFSALWEDIIISEFLPDPEGSDDEEWIELYNSGIEAVNLSGFSLQDNSSRRFIIDEDSDLNLDLLAGQYFLLSKEISGVSLNNSGGDAVKLYNPNGDLQETIEYSDAIEGRSFAREQNNFIWTKNPTPGTANIFVSNQIPIAQISVEGDFWLGEKISFSAENSFDPDGDDLEYLWNFGAGQNSNKEKLKYQFDKVGTYTVYLQVIDQEGASASAAFSLDIKAKDKEAEIQKIDPEDELIVVPIDLVEDDLIISEFIPNPSGSDDEEWIELYNFSNQDIILAGWQLDDQDGGSKPYKFSTSTIVAKSFLLVKRQDSKITLNNSNDAVRLLDPNGDLWQEVSYGKVPEGNSYAWDFENSEWFILDQPSPGQENKNLTNNLSSSSASAEKRIYFAHEVKELESGQELLLQGVAINSTKEPTRSLYLANWQDGQAYYDDLVEVYSYYKAFPSIFAGQVVTVSGVLSKNGSLSRVKIKNSEDVLLNDAKIDLPEPEIIDISSLDDSFVGGVVRIKGVVVKKSGKNIYLAEAEGDDYSLRLYTDFDNKELNIKKNNEIVATGILSVTDNNFKLTSFSPKDVWVPQEVLGEKIIAEDDLGKDLSTTTENILPNARKNKTKNILIFLSLAIFILGLVYSLKRKKAKLDRF